MTWCHHIFALEDDQVKMITKPWNLRHCRHSLSEKGEKKRQREKSILGSGYWDLRGDRRVLTKITYMEIEANLNEMLLEIGVRDMEKHGILCLVLRTRRPNITLQSIQHCSHGFFPFKKKKKKKQGSDLLVLPGCGRRLETNDTNKN